MLYPSAPLGFNGLEILCVGLVLLAIGLVGRRLGWSRRETLAALVLVAPVLVLTAAEATQFMTNDEWGISIELFEPAHRAMRQISHGAFGTGILVALPVARVCEVLGTEATTIRMILKAVWWLLGNGIVIALCVSLLRLRGDRRLDPAAFAVVFTGLAILPTTQLALKTVNYDLFSFGLGVLGLFYLLRAVLQGDHRFFWLALVTATLAAQEKLLAGPILVLVIAAASVGAARDGEPIGARVVKAVACATRNLAASLAITAASLMVYRALGGPPLVPSFWSLALGPISSWTWIPLGIALPIETILQQRGWIAIASIGALVSAIAALAAARPIWLGAWRRAASIPLPALMTSILVLPIGIFVVGVVGALSVQAYWAPYHPTPLAKLAPLQKLNGVALHVGATTYAAHLGGLVLYAIGILVVAVPSGVWAVGFAGIALSAWRRNEQDRFTLAVAALLFGASLLLPIAAALTGVPFAHRYFNLSIALLASGLLIAGIAALGSDWRSGRWVRGVAAAIVFTAICCGEAAPFRPLFAAFRPFWLNYADA